MSLKLQLQGYRLTTANITYHMPDHPNLLQEFIWQNMDIAPKYPKLSKFLDFWEREIEGALNSVRVTSAELITPAEFKLVGHSLTLH